MSKNHFVIQKDKTSTISQVLKCLSMKRQHLLQYALNIINLKTMVIN